MHVGYGLVNYYVLCVSINHAMVPLNPCNTLVGDMYNIRTN
jgi:hypothetical protein